VEAAWRAFVEFSQTEIGGVAPADEDGDGFIVQWGRRSWGDNRLLLTLTRQLAVADLGERDDPDWQAELWQVELEIAFDDEPALVAVEPVWTPPMRGSGSIRSARCERRRWSRHVSRRSGRHSSGLCGQRFR
jgi:hypothetical protein